MPTMKHLSILLVRAQQTMPFEISNKQQKQLTRSVMNLEEAVKKDYGIFHSDIFMIPEDTKLGPCATHIHDMLDAILSSPDLHI